MEKGLKPPGQEKPRQEERDPSLDAQQIEVHVESEPGGENEIPMDHAKREVYMAEVVKEEGASLRAIVSRAGTAVLSTLKKMAARIGGSAGAEGEAQPERQEEVTPERKTLFESLQPYRRYVAAMQLCSFLVGCDGANKEGYEDLGSQIDMEMSDDDVDWDEIDAHYELEGYRDDPYQGLKAVLANPLHTHAKEILIIVAQERGDLLEGAFDDLVGEEYFDDVMEEYVYSNAVAALRSANRGLDNISALNPFAERVEDVMGQGNADKTALINKINEGDFSSGEREMLSSIVVFLMDHGSSEEDMERIAEDDHAYMDALVYSAANGHPWQMEAAKDVLQSIVGDRLIIMDNLEDKSGRYAAVEGASSAELYAMIAFGETQATWTTRYLHGLLEKALKKEAGEKSILDRMEGSLTREGGVNGLIDSMNGAGYSQFVKNMAAGNRMEQFIDMANTDQGRRDLINEFVRNIDPSPSSGNIGHVAQVIAYDHSDEVSGLIRKAVEEEYANAVEAEDLERIDIYGTLSALYQEDATWLGDRSAEYEFPKQEGLSAEKMYNKWGENVQVHYYFADKDGHWSFLNFMQQHDEKHGWSAEDHGSFVIVSKDGEGGEVVIYANKPTASVGGDKEVMEADFSELQRLREGHGWGDPGIADVPRTLWEDGRPDGMADMKVHMEKEEREPHVQVHRGHSFYNGHTYKRLEPSVQLVIMASCDGEATVQNVFKVNPDAQTIYTTWTGTVGVNDAMLGGIDGQLLTGEGIEWDGVRKYTVEHISDSYEPESEKLEEARSKYHSYVFPGDERGMATLAQGVYELKSTKRHSG
jgi:hypothetical protein